jgi:hypothetical protein
VWLEQFPLGAPAPFSQEHLGLVYPGEVVRVDRWSPKLAGPLAGDVYFRIILLTLRRGGLRPAIRDRRIALCLPAAGLSRRRSQLSEELARTRETQAIYLTQRDADADLIRRTLQRRQDEVEEQLLAEESMRYSDGQILTGAEHQPYPHSIFTGLDPLAWFSRLAGRLLAEAYPSLPLDAAALPRPVAATDAAELYAALFDQPGSRPDILQQLGPSLGLSTPSEPSVFNASFCPVMELVRRRLSGQPGPADWGDLHRYLAHDVGLTGPLANLFLLLYLHREGRDLAVDLSPSHSLTLLDGRPMLARRLTSDLLPGLRWNEGVAGWGRSVGPPDELQWNDALQHLNLLSPRLTGVAEEGDFGPQELSLRQDIEFLARELSQARELMELLGRAQEIVERPDGGAARDGGVDSTAESLSRLSRVLSQAGGGFRAAYHAVRAEYYDYRQLEADLAGLRQIAQLGRSAEEILQAQKYLEEAVVNPNLFPSLSIDRQALRAALAPASLLQSMGRSWGALSREVSGFKSRYATAYRAHHETLQQALPAYKQDFETGQRKLRALDLLNTLPELGEPAGAGLAESLGNLGAPPESCPVPGPDLDLDIVPRCSRCGLSLERSLPTAPLARVLTAIDADLAAKNRRLSNLLVDRILQGQNDLRLDDLLKIVRASDLSTLSNTLDVELVEFIRQVIG